MIGLYRKRIYEFNQLFHLFGIIHFLFFTFIDMNVKTTQIYRKKEE